mmetsp:Transcript_11887/g.55223  ORF Transcript_11887/g.55223 Transcript_11887/m.55223 type:complete len:225 (+) Transcript_11887:252-926(+)
MLPERPRRGAGDPARVGGVARVVTGAPRGMPAFRGQSRGDLARPRAQPADARGAGHPLRSFGDARAAGDLPPARQLRRSPGPGGARRETGGTTRGGRARRRRARGGVQAILIGHAEAAPDTAAGRHPAPGVPPRGGIPPPHERPGRGRPQADVPAVPRGPRRGRRRGPRRHQRVRVPQATHRPAPGSPLRRRHAIPRHLRGWARGRGRRFLPGWGCRPGCRPKR